MKIGGRLKGGRKAESKWSCQESNLDIIHFDIIISHRQGYSLPLAYKTFFLLILSYFVLIYLMGRYNYLLNIQHRSTINQHY